MSAITFWLIPYNVVYKTVLVLAASCAIAQARCVLPVPTGPRTSRDAHPVHVMNFSISLLISTLKSLSRASRYLLGMFEYFNLDL